MPDQELLARLADHTLLGAVPAEEREWIAAHGRLRRLEVGELLASPSFGDIRETQFILAGRVSMYVDRPLGPRKVVEWVAGDVTGFLPYSRMNAAPGTARADEPTQVLSLDAAHLPEMIRRCPLLTEKLVQRMLDRARLFTKNNLQDEKMMALGRLSAGLAHELDNPAAAVVRSAKLLGPLLAEADAAARSLGALDLPPAALHAMAAIRDDCHGATVLRIRSPLEQARHEEAIADWLDDRGLDPSEAEALADSPVTVGMLDELAASVPADHLGVALRWVATGCSIRALSGEIADSAERMSDLVRAVKGYTQRDSAAISQPVDIRPGFAQTLALHRSRAREKSAAVHLELDPELPLVQGVAGELNQVWANLIGNALDAVEPGGTVRVIARPAGSMAAVSIVDDGPGIPPENIDRIFEPFFTTKPVGEGTGLGLDIVRRILDDHRGDVVVDSRPGRTEFRVVLPLADSAAPAAMPRHEREGEVA